MCAQTKQMIQYAYGSTVTLSFFGHHTKAHAPPPVTPTSHLALQDTTLPAAPAQPALTPAACFANKNVAVMRACAIKYLVRTGMQ